MTQRKIICLFTQDQDLQEKMQNDVLVKDFSWVLKVGLDYEEVVNGYYSDKDEAFIVCDYEEFVALSKYKSFSNKDKTYVLLDSIDPEGVKKLREKGIQHFYLKSDFKIQKLMLALESSIIEDEISDPERLYNILIVDDVKSNLMLLQHHLKSEFWTLFTAENGYEAIEQIVKNDIHLVVLDIQLPDMDGYEVAHFLKRNIFTQSIPIIFLTAFNKESEQVVKGLEYGGAVDYLYKPVDGEVLRSKINTFIKLFEYRKALEKKNNLLNEQKKKIDEANQELTDNINYATHIQQSIIPTKEELKKSFKECFVLYQPKDLLSGDFYHVFQKKNVTIWIMADCTGHGVTGALLSMLVFTAINKIINELEVVNPAKIVQLLNEEIIESLKKNTDFPEGRDGVELGIACFEHLSKKLSYTGVNVPLWILNTTRKNWSSIEMVDDRGLGSLKGSKATIGRKEYDLSGIEVQELELDEGDLFIMFTDGLIDQLGGQSFEKFKKHRLVETLFNQDFSDVVSIGKHISTVVRSWQGDEQQTDDISLMMVRVK